jgi:hypothetical protein
MDQRLGNAAMPITPMQEARAGLNNAVGALHSRIAQLESRVEVVCRPSTPRPPGTDPKAAEIPSELRAFLNEHTNGIEQACERLDDLLRRIEL